MLVHMQVFTEIARVLKPGGVFLSYEWVSTPMYDASNAEHVRIMDEILFGNGLPEMRTWKQAEEAGKKAGLELVSSLDLATASIVAGPWQVRCSWGGVGGRCCMCTVWAGVVPACKAAVCVATLCERHVMPCRRPPRPPPSHKCTCALLLAPPPTQGRLAELATTNRMSGMVVNALDAMWLAPKGLRNVHNMLSNVATSLVAGGDTGVFTPMHMLVFRKPDGGKK